MFTKAVEREMYRVEKDEAVAKAVRHWKTVAQELAVCHDSYRMNQLTKELLEAITPQKMRETERELA